MGHSRKTKRRQEIVFTSTGVHSLLLRGQANNRGKQKVGKPSFNANRGGVYGSESD